MFALDLAYGFLNTLRRRRITNVDPSKNRLFVLLLWQSLQIIVERFGERGPSATVTFVSVHLASIS